MPTTYINFNGNILPEEQEIFSIENRAVRYGDGLFETMLFKDGEIRFLTFHMERLQKGMLALHLEDVNLYDEFFFRSKVEELIRKNNMVGQLVRIRLTVFRNGGGLYSPHSNKPSYVFQVAKPEPNLKDKKVGLIVDLYTEYKKPFSDLSKIKSLNSQIYVLAGIHKKKMGFDDVLLLNQEGFLCEALSSNIFVHYEKTLYTPALSEGCIEGVMRRVVIDMAIDEGIEVVEAQISPQIMKEAEEIFLTNAVQGVQWVMGYKQKRYFNKISRILQNKLQNWNYNDPE
jgi:branched-chain amino acid aminotransferase